MEREALPDKHTIARTLAALKELQTNRAWIDLLEPKLRAAAKAHLQGSLDRQATPEQRAEHIQAFDFAAEIVGCDAIDRKPWLETQIATYTAMWAQLTAGEKEKTGFGD